MASQPTMSRWENAPNLRTLIRLTCAMVDVWCKSYRRAPKAITLDIDDTADTVHGHQQLSMFNAHYDERCFLPIHVYDADTGHCVLTILRPGKTPDGKEVSAHLRRLVRTHPAALAKHPHHHPWRQSLRPTRSDGLVRAEPRPLYLLACPPTRSWPRRSSPRPMTCASGVRPAIWMWCATTPRLAMPPKSWLHLRRVVARIEATRKGLDVRYVVTNIAYAYRRVALRRSLLRTWAGGEPD